MNLEEHKYWYNNGQLWAQEFLRDGCLEGNYKEWHINGQLRIHQFYQDGKLEGKSKEWRDNGQIWEILFYRNDGLEGERKIYLENGKPRMYGFYRDGECISFYFRDRNRRAFFRFKKSLQNHDVRQMNTFLISDLAKTIYSR